MYPINKANRIEHRYSNGITFIYEWLEDGWIAIYKQREDLSLIPVIQACNESKADSYIAMIEPAPVWLNSLI